MAWPPLCGRQSKVPRSAAIGRNQMTVGLDHRRRTTSSDERGRRVPGSGPCTGYVFVSFEDRDGGLLPSVSLLLEQQEGETQMHADKKGCTQIPAAPTLAHCLPAARHHLRASLLIGVHLRFPFLCRRWREHRSDDGMPGRCAPDGSGSTPRLVGETTMRRWNIVAAASPLCDHRGKPSSRSMLYRVRIANSVRAAMICAVSSAEDTENQSHRGPPRQKKGASRGAHNTFSVTLREFLLGALCEEPCLALPPAQRWPGHSLDCPACRTTTA